MLEFVDEALEGLLRAGVPLGAQDVDVSFEAPEKEWSAKLNRPTINLYLWDMRLSIVRARTGTQIVERDGVTSRRLALPRIELRYLITVWTSDHNDERSLMGGLLRTVLSYHEIPFEFVPPALHSLPLMTMSMVRSDERRGDIFGLSDRYKNGLNIVVTTAIETDAMTPVGPPTESLDFRLNDRVSGATDRPPRRVAGEVNDPAAVGSAVTTARGKGTVNAAGRFLVAGVAGDEVVLHTDPPRVAVVPAEGGIVFP